MIKSIPFDSFLPQNLADLSSYSHPFFLKLSPSSDIYLKELGYSPYTSYWPFDANIPHLLSPSSQLLLSINSLSLSSLVSLSCVFSIVRTLLPCQGHSNISSVGAMEKCIQYTVKGLVLWRASEPQRSIPKGNLQAKHGYLTHLGH